MDTKLKILFLCIGNSARSQIAEALFNEMASDYFDCFSAGSIPSGEVHPVAIKLLSDIGIDISRYKPKSWDGFSNFEFDYVVSLCEEDVENCPAILTKAVKAKWRLPDPVRFEGDPDQVEKAFRETILNIRSRLNNFLALYDKQKWKAEEITTREADLKRIHEDRLIEEFSSLFKHNLDVIPPKSQGLICIYSSDLKLVIREALSKKIRGDIAGATSLVIATVATLLSAKFKQAFFSPDGWVAIFSIILTCSIAWVIFSIYSRFTKFSDAKIEEHILKYATQNQDTIQT